jgi:hypothetical protein
MNQIKNIFKKTNFTVVFLSFFLLVAFLNDGFMGTDEYWNAMVKYLPAQTATYTDLVDQTDVKSPLQVMPMHLGSQIALKLGVFHPYDQYRFTILFITIINLLIYLLSFQTIQSVGLWNFGKDFQLPDSVSLSEWQDTCQKVFLFLFTFYFASSFTLTRPMFESLAAPWILLSMALFYKYQSTQVLKYVIGSTVAVSLAFVMRQQAGIGAVTIPLLLLIAKDKRGFLVSSAVGLVCFVLAGIPDIFLRGGFHHSLWSVLTYNVEHGHEYGNGSILFYPLLLMGLSFFPFLWINSGGKSVHTAVFKKLNFAWVFIALFVALHSYFPQKFERFMVSIIPLVIVLMTPYFTRLVFQWPRKKWQLITMGALNLFILINASFFPSQKNIINAALFIDKHNGIKTIYNLDKTLEWIPEKFIYLNRGYSIVDLPLAAVKDQLGNNCQAAIIVNDFILQEQKETFKDFQIIDTFQVNWIERLAYRFNKKNNIRRAPLHVLSNCQHMSAKLQN